MLFPTSSRARACVRAYVPDCVLCRSITAACLSAATVPVFARVCYANFLQRILCYVRDVEGCKYCGDTHAHTQTADYISSVGSIND